MSQLSLHHYHPICICKLASIPPCFRILSDLESAGRVWEKRFQIKTTINLFKWGLPLITLYYVMLTMYYVVFNTCNIISNMYYIVSNVFPLVCNMQSTIPNTYYTVSNKTCILSNMYNTLMWTSILFLKMLKHIIVHSCLSDHRQAN